MNTDPWTNLVATLSGARRQQTPARWPSARVHRMLDDPTPAVIVPPRRLVSEQTPATAPYGARPWAR